ncbi:MAG: carbohydrate kinase family protein [Promethearchaeota archaeon]
MQPQKGALVPAIVQILSIGDANAELVFSQLEKMPMIGREVVVPGVKLQAAGSAANFALSTANLGVKTGFAGRLAVDQFGEVVLKAFREADVDTRFLRLVEDSSTGITVSMVREDGKRAFVTYPGTNSQLSQKELKTCLSKDPPPRWVHLAGYHLLDSLHGEPTASILELARSRGATTSLDMGSDPSGGFEKPIEVIKTILQFVDIFFLNSNEVKVLTGERSPQKGAKILLDAGAPTLVVKLFNKGCLLATKRDQHLIPSFKVKVVNTTAAGDAFAAGFVVSMLSGATMGRAGVFANAVAALRVSRRSDQHSFPTLQETTAFLMKKRPLEA